MTRAAGATTMVRRARGDQALVGPAGMNVVTASSVIASTQRYISSGRPRIASISSAATPTPIRVPNASRCAAGRHFEGSAAVALSSKPNATNPGTCISPHPIGRGSAYSANTPEPPPHSDGMPLPAAMAPASKQEMMAQPATSVVRAVISGSRPSVIPWSQGQGLGSTRHCTVPCVIRSGIAVSRVTGPLNGELLASRSVRLKYGENTKSRIDAVRLSTSSGT